MTAFCPHCDSDLGGYLVLTSDGHSFRSYWCREHGDVVPIDYLDEERMQGILSDVQDGIPTASIMAELAGEGIIPEQWMPSET